jgi:hypothetical protein
VLAAIAVVGALQEPVELAPDGTTVLRRLLDARGIPVRDGERPSRPPATFVLLADARDDGQVSEVLAWVEEGGRLVVADPGSLVLPRLGIEGVPSDAFLGTDERSPGCVTRATRAVRGIVIAAVEAELVPTVGGIACFPGERGAFAVTVPHGRGEVVLLGGRSFLVDDLLDRADNARFALQVLDAGGGVAFGPPEPGAAGGRSGVWDVLPSGAKVAVAFAVLAGLLFGVARSRRLGKPVLEEPVSPIPGSELVEATAALYRRARATGFAGHQLRAAAAARLSRRLGVPPDVPADALPDVLAAAGSLDAQRLRRVLAAPEPEDDEELIALGRELERILDEVEGAHR